jgi:hypothetical protein
VKNTKNKEHEWSILQEGINYYQKVQEFTHNVPANIYSLDDMINVKLKGGDEIKQKLRVVDLKRGGETDRDEITLVLEWSAKNEAILIERLRRLGYIA